MTFETRATVDLRGEIACGDSALQIVRRALAQHVPGDLITVIADVPEHAFTIRAWAHKTGREIVSDGRTDGVTIFVLHMASHV